MSIPSAFAPPRSAPPLLQFDPATFPALYDREPFGFRHRLSGHPLLQLDALRALALRMPARQVLHRRGIVATDSDFDHAADLHPNGLGLSQTLDALVASGSFVTINNPELDPAYRPLLDELLNEIRCQTELVDPGMAWFASYFFISAPGAVTPFHMDRELNFLVQLRGEKLVKLWSPAVLTELEKERLFGRWDLPRPALRPEVAASGREFLLRPGDGVHHPFIAPHLVVTGAELSISLAVTFRTARSNQRSAAWQVNHRLRELGLRPAPVGDSPLRDRMKAGALFAARAVLKRARPTP